MDSGQQYKVIGLMSGTSLDGVDIAYCIFKFSDTWSFSIVKSATIKYPAAWHRNLSEAHLLSGEALVFLDVEYGKFLGSLCLNFIHENKIRDVDFIASHGHTIFHQPKKNTTFQLGNGNAIYAVANLPVVYDFRSLDVLRGGQGAPLVPIGDKFLFEEYDVCLNVGGIANLSGKSKNGVQAFDVCFANMGLNYLASKAGKKFDRNGTMSNKGEINKNLLKRLDAMYSKISKKRPSLGREYFNTHLMPLLDDKKIPLHDRMRTFTESVAKEVSKAILGLEIHRNVLCTGGGTFNSFFIYRLIELLGDESTLIIPEDEVINFKEALVFAFLGVLKVRGEVNCLKSVTGALQDSSGGVLVGF